MSALQGWRRVDAATQRWVRATGREVDPGSHAWLSGPVGDEDGIADRWLEREALRLGARLPTDAGAQTGLLPTMGVLDGDGFAAASLSPVVRDFYERTSAWRLDAWVAWSAWAWPGGWLVSTAFARRLQQLALPLRPLDVAHGMSSSVRPLQRGGEQVGALWLRTLRATGDVVFSGLYGVVPLADGTPAVRVCFPLPHGRLVVLLRPQALPDGSLVLSSGPARWGDAGAYLVVEDAGRCWARRVPLHERFHVFVDGEGVLRTDHRLALGAGTVLRLHYRLTPSSDAGGPDAPGSPAGGSYQGEGA